MSLQIRNDYKRLWDSINHSLIQHQKFWQFRPFGQNDFPWKKSHPGLSKWLSTLSLSDISALDADIPQLYAHVSQFLPAVSSPEMIQLPQSWRENLLENLEKPETHVPGRKWAQVQYFASCLDDSKENLLEWCAGKGHLGRYLASSKGYSVTSVEISGELSKRGEKLASGAEKEMRFVTADVMEEGIEPYISETQNAVALHACGDLHRRLVTLAERYKMPRIAIAPCCYHRHKNDIYQPLSTTVSQSSLRLQRFDLQLALQETVTASKRIRKLRQRERRWRLGFDLIQREISGSKHYLTVPSVKESLLNKTFPEFCFWAAEKREIHLPAELDFDFYLEKAIPRGLQVARMELIRHLFRRPLELWLVLDLALFLLEKGYQISLGEFCPKKITPRNILLQAWL